MAKIKVNANGITDGTITATNIADGTITSGKILDGTIANADIANSTINLTTKVTGSLPVANGGTGLTALGTANQVLRVNSGGTAPEWATTADQTPLTTKGDLFGFDTADARIPVGTNGHILTADSTQSLGLKWAAPAGGGANWSLLNSGGTALTGAATITISSISGKDKIMILVEGASASANAGIDVRLNTDTASNYYRYGAYQLWDNTYNKNNASGFSSAGTSFPIASLSNTTSSVASGYCLITGCNAAGVKMIQTAGSGNAAGADLFGSYQVGGYYNSASTISSVSLFSSAGNFDAGTVYVYASA